MGKYTSLAQAGLLVVVLGSGCGIVPGGGAETCVDWVRFESPQDQYDQAGIVLIGRSVGEDGETSLYGYRATTHRIEVERVLKGDPGAGILRVSSTPQTCTGGESYPDGDPLATDQRVIIFATQQGTEWFTLTPAQGILPFQQGKELPFQPSVTPPAAPPAKTSPSIHAITPLSNRLPTDSSPATGEVVPWTLVRIDNEKNRIYLSAGSVGCLVPSVVHLQETPTEIDIAVTGAPSSASSGSPCTAQKVTLVGYVRLDSSVDGRRIVGNTA
jgi:hypothetical protein